MPGGDLTRYTDIRFSLMLDWPCDITVLAASLSWRGQAVVRLLAAAVLGAAIGVEREHRGQNAGFRTQLLVALGSALAMVVSLHFGEVYARWGGSVRVDPARVAYGVMGGVGFLGAGTILRYGPGIRGLTTAATLWCTAAVGLACGFGMFLVALAATVVMVFALVVLRKLDFIIPSRLRKVVTVICPTTGADAVGQFQRLLLDRGARVHDVQYIRDERAKTQTVTFHVSLSSRRAPADLIDFGEAAPEIICASVE